MFLSVDHCMLLTLFWVYSLHASTACFCLNRHYGCFYPDSLMAKSIQNSRTPKKYPLLDPFTTQEGILYVPNYTNYTHWTSIISAEQVEFMTLDPYGPMDPLWSHLLCDLPALTLQLALWRHSQRWIRWVWCVGRWRNVRCEMWKDLKMTLRTHTCKI